MLSLGETPWTHVVVVAGHVVVTHAVVRSAKVIIAARWEAVRVVRSVSIVIIWWVVVVGSVATRVRWRHLRHLGHLRHLVGIPSCRWSTGRRPRATKSSSRCSRDVRSRKWNLGIVGIWARVRAERRLCISKGGVEARS